MTRISHALGLLDTLPHLSAVELAAVLNARGITVSDPVDAWETAQELAKPEAIWHQLEQLTREQLEQLLHPDTLSQTEANRLHSELLLERHHDSVSLRPEVAAVWPVSARQEGLPAVTTPESSEESDGLASPDVSVVFGHLDDIERVLRAISHDGSIVTGELQEKTLERLHTVTGLPAERVHSAWTTAEVLAWIRPRGATWTLTPTAHTWLHQGSLAKWRQAIVSFQQQQPAWWPEPLPKPASVESIVQQARRHYPLVTTRGAQALVSSAEILGIIRDAEPTVLSQRIDADGLSAVLTSLLPARVDSLYPDGPDTLVAAGPLSDDVDSALRAVGVWVSGGLAPRFKVTAESVVGALQQGWTPEAITSVLERCVLGGLHSVLGDNVRDTIEKAQGLRIQPDGEATIVYSTTPLVASLLAADRRVADASFVPLEPLSLRSPRDYLMVHRLLLDEGYPHLVVDSSGALLTLHDSVSLSPSDAWDTRWSVSRAEEFLGSISHQTQSPHLWQRVAETVVAEKTPVAITVEQNGKEHTVDMEPQSLRNGRLRGIDSRSDVERTIPISHVVSIRPRRVSSPEA